MRGAWLTAIFLVSCASGYAPLPRVVLSDDELAVAAAGLREAPSFGYGGTVRVADRTALRAEVRSSLRRSGSMRICDPSRNECWNVSEALLAQLAINNNRSFAILRRKLRTVHLGAANAEDAVVLSRPAIAAHGDEALIAIERAHVTHVLYLRRIRQDWSVMTSVAEGMPQTR